jgi:formate hydrogenlyase subunit 3/multisubunit Na+/H+ antiporter MnhD subunit
MIGLFLSVFRRRSYIVASLGVFTSLFLAILAWLLPTGEAMTFGPWIITIEEQVSIAGLSFLLSNSDLRLVGMFYGFAAFLFIGSLPAQVHHRLLPLGLIVFGLLGVVLAVEPFFYAALILILVVLVNTVIVVTPGQNVNKGILKFLVYQILGLLLILFGGWLLNEAYPPSGDLSPIIRSLLILCLGFVFIFSVFPLYVWIPRTLQDIHPYEAVFVFSNFFGISTVFFLEFMIRYPLLQDVINLDEILRFVGVLMVGTGGAWAAFQRDLGRIFGYAMVIEIGYALISIGISSGDLHYAMLAPRMLALAVWGLGLSIINRFSADLRFSTVQGKARQFQIAAAGVLLAQFSISGLPILAGFPALLETWQQLSLISTFSAIWAFLGSAGLLASGLRTFAVLTMGAEESTFEEKQSTSSQIFLGFGIIGLFLMGLFPHWFYFVFSELVGSFPFP